MKDVEYVTDGNGRNGQGTPVEMSQMMEILENVLELIQVSRRNLLLDISPV